MWLSLHIAPIAVRNGSNEWSVESLLLRSVYETVETLVPRGSVGDSKNSDDYLQIFGEKGETRKFWIMVKQKESWICYKHKYNNTSFVGCVSISWGSVSPCSIVEIEGSTIRLPFPSTGGGLRIPSISTPQSNEWENNGADNSDLSGSSEGRFVVLLIRLPNNPHVDASNFFSLEKRREGIICSRR